MRIRQAATPAGQRARGARLQAFAGVPQRCGFAQICRRKANKSGVRSRPAQIRDDHLSCRRRGNATPHLQVGADESGCKQWRGRTLGVGQHSPRLHSADEIHHLMGPRMAHHCAHGACKATAVGTFARQGAAHTPVQAGHFVGLPRLYRALAAAVSAAIIQAECDGIIASGAHQQCGTRIRPASAGASSASINLRMTALTRHVRPSVQARELLHQLCYSLHTGAAAHGSHHRFCAVPPAARRDGGQRGARQVSTVTSGRGPRRNMLGHAG